MISKGYYLTLILTGLLLALKLTKQIDISYIWVLSPIWIVTSIIAFIFIFAIVLNLIHKNEE